MNEKRKHIRTAFRAEVKLIHPSVGELQVCIRDLSDGGLFLLTGERVELDVGDTVQVQAVDIDDAPVLSARVVRREASGVGLMFIDL